jgi:hypothetical protein
MGFMVVVVTERVGDGESIAIIMLWNNNNYLLVFATQADS